MIRKFVLVKKSENAFYLKPLDEDKNKHLKGLITNTQYFSYLNYGINIYNDIVGQSDFHQIIDLFESKNNKEIVINFSILDFLTKKLIKWENLEFILTEAKELIHIINPNLNNDTIVLNKNNNIDICSAGINSSVSKTIIISLVSDQTGPNVNFIKWYLKYCEPNENIALGFITTPDMQKKEQILNIINGLDEYNKRISNLSTYNNCTKMVDANSISDCQEKIAELRESILKLYDNVIINVTGGTKLMSLASYQAFSISTDKNISIYYLPYAGKESKEPSFLQKLYPTQDYYPMNGLSLNTITSYIQSLGYVVNSIKKTPSKTQRNLKEIFSVRNEKLFKSELSYFVKNNLFKSKYLRDLFQFGYSYRPLECKQYINGQWFEDYVAYYMMNKYSLKQSDIAIGVILSKAGTSNEIDVVFFENETLHLVSCKTNNSDRIEKVAKDALNELRANKEKLGGLAIKLHFCSLYPIDKMSAVAKNAKILDIELLSDQELMIKI